MAQGLAIIVMGVSGSGKSSVAQAVAQQLQIKMLDGDDLHPRANILKMAGGTPLDDQDRAPWLERINDAAFALQHKNEVGLIVCSALKKKYRDLIRAGNQVVFVHLHGAMDVILERMQQRQGHFMKPQMLASQFATLELPDATETDVIPVAIEGTFDEVVAQVISQLRQRFPERFAV